MKILYVSSMRVVVYDQKCTNLYERAGGEEDQEVVILDMYTFWMLQTAGQNKKAYSKWPPFPHNKLPVWLIKGTLHHTDQEQR